MPKMHTEPEPGDPTPEVGSAMLFDERGDPHELRNLAADPARAK